jgi:F-type H+-transporting ATPase subunit delta
MAAIANRYARAFVDVVFAQKLEANRTVQEVQDFADLVKSSSELRNVLENPAVPHEQKLKLLDELASRTGSSRPVRNFIAILVGKRRLGLLPAIAAQIKTEMNERLGLAEVDIVSARVLGSAERGVLEERITRMTGKQVRAHYQQDKNVLGGAIVRVGSTIYDGSVRGQLERIRQSIVE